MVFSRLLLATADAKSYIVGTKREDKLYVRAEAGEIALCFQIDDRERKMSLILDFDEDAKRCDGLVFYAKDGEDDKVICLVEMKSKNIDDVAEQIKATKSHIESMLRHECALHYDKLLKRIKWKACFYCYGSSDDRKRKIIKDDLIKSGFNEIADFGRSKDDMTSFLRGGTNAKNVLKKLKDKKR